MHKYMPQTLDGLKPSKWHSEVKHTRPCYCCLQGMESCHKVSNKVACPLKQVEPCALWSNASEREIKELKEGGDYVQSSKALVGHCSKLEAYIKSNTAFEIKKLNRDVPKTVMSGKT